MCRLPISVRLGTHQKLVLIVIACPETEFADGDFWADNTLVLRVVHESSLARGALEAASVICLRQFLCQISLLMLHSHDQVGFLLFLSRLLLSFTPGLSILFEDLKRIIAPIHTAKWAIVRFSIALVVLEAATEAISVDLTTAAVATVRQVFSFSERVTANAAALVLLEGSSGLNWPLVFF